MGSDVAAYLGGDMKASPSLRNAFDAMCDGGARGRCIYDRDDSGPMKQGSWSTRMIPNLGAVTNLHFPLHGPL